MSGGLHGVGASVVNALSEWLELTVYDGQGHFTIRNSAAAIMINRWRLSARQTRTGTEVVFKADPQIFEDTNYDYETLLTRMREQAFFERRHPHCHERPA